MNKIWLICKREYLTRVQKKSFLVMTLVSPLLIVGLYGIIFYFSVNSNLAEEKKLILVHDETGIFESRLENTANIEFRFTQLSEFPTQKPEVFALLNITKDSNHFRFQLIAGEQPGFGVVSTLGDKLKQCLKDRLLEEKGLNQDLLKEINAVRAPIETMISTPKGMETGNTGITSGVGFVAAFLIYLFIFLYGVQVMKGVIEEKTNRIVEVIISSVKPFQLMMGKILGIALVGFTQFFIWVFLVTILAGPVSSLAGNLAHPEMTAATTLPDSSGDFQQGMLAGFFKLNLPLLFGMFLFYFAGGYLFYGALFAAVGSAVDSETDTQQFMMPITLPLVFSIVMAQSVLNDPNGNLAVWLSMIPLSSPVIMMIRLPFGVPLIQILGSVVFLIAGFIFTVFVAGRIYRIGILSYGKRPTYKELFKWIFRNPG